MKNTFDYFRYLLLFVAVCAFAACSDDDENGNGGDANGSIEIAEDMKAIACVGTGNDSKTITFTAKNDWTAIVSHSWIDLNKRSGNAGENQSLIVTIEDNDEFKTRIGTVTIKDKVSGNSVDITITQGEKGSIFTIAGTNGGDKSQGGTLIINSENLVISDTIHVVSNYEYTVKSDVEWLQPEKVGKNADGSVKYVFHADPAKLYAATGYKEKVATISFAYQADTRAPGTQEYLVKFAGITPTIVFLESSVEDNPASLAAAELTESDGVYQTTVMVQSNIAWTLGKPSDDSYFTADLNGDNNSLNFFTTKTSVQVKLKEGRLDTEDLNSEKMVVVDKNTEESASSLPVVVAGVGNDYVYIDRNDFLIDQTYGCFMFEVGQEYTKVAHSFTLKASDPTKVQFFMTRLSGVAAEPYLDYYDAQWQEMATTNVMEDEWSGWGWVYDAESDDAPMSRSVVQTIKKDLCLNARSEHETGSESGKERYFAFFAIIPDKEDFVYDDLFDDVEGTLKEQYKDSYIVLGQKAKIGFHIESDYLDENPEISVPVAGSTIEIDVKETNLGESNGVYLISDLEWSGEDPYDWSGKDVEFDGDDRFKLSSKTEQDELGTHHLIGLTLKVSPNETGQQREIVCGLSVYVEGQEKNYMVRQFTIKQAAE